MSPRSCCAACATTGARTDEGIAIARPSIGRDHTITGTIRRAQDQRYLDTGIERIDARDLGDPRSIASLQGCPVRRGHGGPRVGVVLRAWVEGSALLATMRIDDRDARDEIAAGDLREFSPGYDRRLDADGFQRDVRFFELAILAPGLARCGAACSVRTDADDVSPSERARASLHTRAVAASAAHTAAQATGPARVRIAADSSGARVLAAHEADPEPDPRGRMTVRSFYSR